MTRSNQNFSFILAHRRQASSFIKYVFKLSYIREKSSSLNETQPKKLEAQKRFSSYIEFWIVQTRRFKLHNLNIQFTIPCT